jgi:hypothetical protein
MRNKHAPVMIVLAVIFMLVSCDGITCGGNDFVPSVVVLQITALNKTDAPVRLNICHALAYDHHGNGERVRWYYSDWLGADIPAGGSLPLGNETAVYEHNGAEPEANGFILWNKSLDNDYHNQYLSFVIETQIAGRVEYFAGYETEDSKYTETQWGEMVTEADDYKRGAGLYIKGERYDLSSSSNTPVFIPVTLTIASDGTVSIEYDEETLQKLNLPH